MYVIIAGGGKVGHYLTRALADAGHEVLLIEKDRARVDYLAEDLGEAVTFGDACEVRTMRETGMERADVVVAVTGDDEDNLVICQLSKSKFQVPRAISKVNNPENDGIFKALGIDTTVSSTRIIFNLIEQQIETDLIIPLAPLQRGNIEIVEIDLGPDSPVLGKRIGNIGLPENALVISIVREGHAILPNIDVEFKEGDSVIALVNADMEPVLRGIFAGN
ncbi:TrkA family potassium uptake protein [uncultured Desulfobulbus sp.]|uniref:potassium channel family protein n=1 Tax=uncultured Desulfobulbus sp. TaxID=239745 RepID=UPI0029C74723|nr:TrkA family potassium uptake protein [uncultured Desulfobulbus sp.]